MSSFKCRCRLKSVPTALRRLSLKLLCLLILHLSCGPASAVLRDCWYGQFDPANVGKGAWLYILSSATNHLGGNVPSVTDVDSMFAYIKSQGMQHVIVKAGTSNMLWTGSGNVSTNNTAAAQFSPSLVQKAHNAGLLIFGSNRSYGSDLDGENNVARYVFSVGADGFIWDAEAEWESGHPGITNGPVQAWYMCGQLRAAFPTKFLAHNPFDTLYLHSSFPFKEFGYFADVVIPQVYHHAASKGSASAAINWTDVNYNTWQNSLTGTSSNINGQTIYWTNSIKPVWYMREIYNGTSGTTATPPNDITEFVDYMQADVNCPSSKIGFNSANWFRVELYSPTQWATQTLSTIGTVSNVVNNICIDEASAAFVGSWTPVTTISCTTGAVTFSGDTGTDTNAFGISYRKKATGDGSSYAQFTPKILTAGDYNLYQWHPFRGDASASVPIVVNYSGGSTTVYANQTTNAGIWSFVGKFPFATGPTTIRITDATLDGNTPMADGIKLMFVYPTATPAVPSNLVATAIS
ncbi:MAG: golvesin C-terminal-like domain-containing protein, partial [Limisphaerales bacterium]